MGFLWWKNYIILQKQNLLKIVESYISQVLRFNNLHFDQFQVAKIFIVDQEINHPKALTDNGF